jgi:hypothetical protein
VYHITGTWDVGSTEHGTRDFFSCVDVVSRWKINEVLCLAITKTSAVASFFQPTLRRNASSFNSQAQQMTRRLPRSPSRLFPRQQKCPGIIRYVSFVQVAVYLLVRAVASPSRLFRLGSGSRFIRLISRSVITVMAINDGMV